MDVIAPFKNPDQSTMDMIRGYLMIIDILRQKMKAPEGLRYRSHEGFVFDLGQVWTPQQLPEEYMQMTPKACYENAATLVMDDPDLRYVEGFALSERGILPVMHAWAATVDGRVIDPTWDNPAGATYLGVEIPICAVQTMQLVTGFTGFFGNDYQVGFLILKLGRIPTEEEIRRAWRERRREERYR
jgi:hypothetical protein